MKFESLKLLPNEVVLPNCPHTRLFKALIGMFLSFATSHSFAATLEEMIDTSVFETEWLDWQYQWRDLHVVDPSRMRIENSAKGGSERVAMFEVKNGDKVSGWAGERSEVAWMVGKNGKTLPVNTDSGVEYYTIKVKLSKDWRPPETDKSGYSWGTFFQLHGPDYIYASPAIALMAESDFHLNICAGEILNDGPIRKAMGPKIFPFSKNALNVGTWVSFGLLVKWTTNLDGFVKVFRKDQDATDWDVVLDAKNIPTLQTNGTKVVHNHYWKTGYYRSSSAHTNRLWIGKVTRVRLKEEVTGPFFRSE